MIDEKEQVKRYRELMGDEATARQLTENAYRRKCCWTRYVEDHHPDCKSNPKKRAAKEYRKYYGNPESPTETEL